MKLINTFNYCGKEYESAANYILKLMGIILFLY